MKSLSLFLFSVTAIVLTTNSAFTATALAANKKSASKSSSKKSETSTSETKNNETAEYKIILDENYETFRTRTYQKLELSENCFKSEKPNCQAYTVSLEKGPKVTLNQFGSNNKAALNCKNMGGKNLVALDKDRNEFGFCKFGDGSMVTIWSMYFKTNPPPTIK